MHAKTRVTGAYNFFRRKQEPALCCAVRQDRPVPPFVESAAWEYCGTVVDNGTMRIPAGFRPAAAELAMSRNGFYIFHAIQA